MNIFQILTSGDTAQWRDGASTFKQGQLMTSSEWVLKYILRGPSALTITAEPDGDGWISTLALSDSVALLPGLYKWSATLSKESERVTVGVGSLTIVPDLSLSDESGDVRSKARIALDDCETALATFNKTGGKVKKYQIGARQMEFQSLAELMQVLRYWKLKVRNEEAEERLVNGKSNKSNLMVRF